MTIGKTFCNVLLKRYMEAFPEGNLKAWGFNFYQSQYEYISFRQKPSLLQHNDYIHNIVFEQNPQAESVEQAGLQLMSRVGDLADGTGIELTGREIFQPENMLARNRWYEPKNVSYQFSKDTNEHSNGNYYIDRFMRYPFQDIIPRVVGIAPEIVKCARQTLAVTAGLAFIKNDLELLKYEAVRAGFRDEIVTLTGKSDVYKNAVSLLPHVMLPDLCRRENMAYQIKWQEDLRRPGHTATENQYGVTIPDTSPYMQRLFEHTMAKLNL